MHGLREKIRQAIGNSDVVGKTKACLQSALTIEIQHQQRGRGLVFRIPRVLIVILRDEGQSEQQRQEKN